jgi:hypothetical protein
MLQHLGTVLRLGPDEARPVLLAGDAPGADTQAALNAMRGDRPSARKHGGALLVVAPGGSGGWIGWVFSAVPPVTELPEIIQRVGAISLAMGGGGAPEAAAKSEALSLLSGRLASAGRLRQRGVLQAMADGIPESGLAEAAVLLDVSAGRVGRPVYSDRALETAGDEVRALAARLRDAGETRLVARADDLEEDGLDAALVLSSVGQKTMVIDVPPRGEAGIAIALFGPTRDAEGQIAGLRDLANLALRRRSGQTTAGGRRLRRVAVLAAGLAILAWLAWPVPRVVTATGLTRPAEAVSVALHFDAFLEEMAVSVGDRVEAGEIIATFASPALEERRAEVALDIMAEEVAAQSALAENDYGAFVLSEQRISAHRRRLDNLEARLEGLTLRAPVSGQVVAAKSAGRVGAFVPAGEEVALLQSEPRFELTLDFLRVDAPLVAPGQVGEVYFRGISGESFPFTISTPVMVERDPQTGEERLTARATIVAEGQGRLLTGLSGYGRILSDPAPRALNLARYAIEYVRVKAWSYLGLRW